MALSRPERGVARVGHRDVVGEQAAVLDAAVRGDDVGLQSSIWSMASKDGGRTVHWFVRHSHGCVVSARPEAQRGATPAFSRALSGRRGPLGGRASWGLVPWRDTWNRLIACRQPHGLGNFFGGLLGGSWGIGLCIWALLIGFSRIHLGVHYPGDVLGGFVLGWGIGILCLAMVRRMIMTLENQKKYSHG